MLRNVSGGHIQLVTEHSRKLFYSKAGCLKVCHPAFNIDLLQEFHSINPDSPVAGRLIDDGADFNNMRVKTQQAIRLFEPAFKIFNGNFYVNILPNEKYTEGIELRRLSDMTVVCAQDIHAAGARPLGFSLPVGNPRNPEDADIMWAAAVELDKLDGAIDYHNYAIPTQMLSQDLDLRHEAMAEYLPMNTKWWLGEGLFDHGILGPPLAGWRYPDFHIDVEFTARYVRRIAQRLSRNPRVIAWTPFGAGPANDWLTFQYDNEPLITQIFQELYEVDVDGTHRIGQGFRRMIPYLGAPLEDEVYHFPGTPMETSLAVFENGTATWYKVANITTGIRSDGAVFTDKGNAGDGSTIWKIN